jgi:hypothetical protein
LRCDVAFCARSDSELPYDDDDHVIDFLNATCFQAISMSATVLSLPPSGIAETLDFLRRLEPGIHVFLPVASKTWMAGRSVRRRASRFCRP